MAREFERIFKEAVSTSSEWEALLTTVFDTVTA